MNIWIIVYWVIAYLFIGAVFAAVLKSINFIDEKDIFKDLWEITAVTMWPVYILTFILCGICALFGLFIDYMVKQITKKED